MKKFKEILSKSKLHLKLKILESFLPRSAMIYNVIKLKLELELIEESTMQIDLFSYSGDCLGFLTLINVKELPQTLVVIFNPTKPSENFLTSLENLIDWSQPNQFEGVENPVADFIKTCAPNYGQLELHDPIDLYYMENETALKFQHLIPTNGAIVKQLSAKDAKKIDTVWPASCPGSLEMIAASISFVGSGGVFISDVEDSESLVSWAVGLPFGSIHALHTLEKHQGKGFAKMTMQSVSKNIAEKGRIPVAQIYKNNDTSKALNLKIGFVYSHDINLMHFQP